MAKRSAEFQMTKDEGGGMPDFQFGASPVEVGGIQPHRATAQQMAKRKIATGKKPRPTSSGMSTPQAPQQQSSFTFSGNQSNPWSGSFGATSSAFGSGGSQTTPNNDQKSSFTSSFGQTDTPSSQNSSNSPDKPRFSFGSSQSASTPVASLTPASNAAANIPFSFAANSAVTTNSTPSSSVFQSSNQPTVNGLSGTGQTNFFNPQPMTNGVDSAKSSNPFSFTPTSTATSKPVFGDSTPAKPANPFQSAAIPQSTTIPPNPFPTTNGVTAPSEDKILTDDEVSRVKEFLAQIQPKFQTMDRFRQETKSEITNISNWTTSKTADQVVEEFAEELQRILPQITDTADGSPPKITLSSLTYRLLLAMMDKHFPKPVQAPSFFSPKPATSNTTSNSFTPKPVETGLAANPFTNTNASNGASFTPFSTSKPAPTAPAPMSRAAPTSSLDSATLREMLRAEAQQQLPALANAIPAMDTKKVGDMLPSLFSSSFTSIRPDDLPADADLSLLREAAKEGVSQAFAKLQGERAQSALTEAAVRDMFNDALQNALPAIHAVLEKAVRSSGVSQGGPASLEEALPEARNLRAQCDQIQPPTSLSTEPYTIDKLNPVHRQQFSTGWRIKLFSKAVEDMLHQFSGDPAIVSKIISEYDRLRLEMAQAAGIKRKTPSDTSMFADNGLNKRPNLGTTNMNGGFFSTPTTEKRAAEADEPSPTAKRPRGDSSSTPGGSQTSQLFASLAQKPASDTSTLSQPNHTQNFFGAVAQSPNNTAQPNSTILFAAAAQSPAKTAQSAAGTDSSSPNKSSDTPATMPKPPQFNIAPPASGNSFFAQFQQKASQTAAKDKAKRKAEDFDSDEETEEEWETRDAEAQAAKRQKLMAGVNASGFVPKIVTSDTGKDSEADNEDSTEESSKTAKSPREKTNGSDSTFASTTPKGKSLFKRVEEAKKDNTSPTLAPNGDKTWKPDTPIKFGSSTTSTADSTRASLFGESPQLSQPGAAAPSGGSMFGTSTNSSSLFTPKAAGSGSLFSQKTSASSETNATSTAPPTFNFTAASPQKTPNEEKPKGRFNFATQTTNAKGADDDSETPKSLFGTTTGTKPSPISMVNPFAHLAENPSLFQAPPSSSIATGGSLTPGGSIFATGGSSRATSPGLTTGDESTGSADEPTKDPQLDLSDSRAGEEQEDVVYELRVKASEYARPDGDESSPREWITRGLGPLKVLKNKESGKARMVMRAGPASRVVLNTGLSKAKYENPTSKSVAFIASNLGNVCKWTLQVGKAEDATTLREMLEKYKDKSD